MIAGMGVTGWEIATVIQTPAFMQSSFTTYTMKLMMFFQRRLCAGQQLAVHSPLVQHVIKHTPYTMATNPYSMATNSYHQNRYSRGNSLPEGWSNPSRNKTPETPGYYNHTLKRYIFEKQASQPYEDEYSTSMANGFIPSLSNCFLDN